MSNALLTFPASMISPAHGLRRLQFDRDTFSFANELLWEYRFDSATGQTLTVKRTPPPSYTLHCFVVVRSARQFFYHASFNPTQPPASPEIYRKLIRKVVSRSPRKATAAENKVLIPGYDCLRSFSKAQENALKAECGGAWQSYFLRSHWRMIFPFSRKRQQTEAQRLIDAISAGDAPIVHVVRFPQLTINHGLMLFDCCAEQDGWRFEAYDPNIPERPTKLTFSREQRSFFLPRNHYWAGGPVDAFQIYRNWLY